MNYYVHYNNSIRKKNKINKIIINNNKNVIFDKLTTFIRIIDKNEKNFDKIDKNATLTTQLFEDQN